MVGEGVHQVENLQESVSVAEDGTLLITLAHLDVEEKAEVEIELKNVGDAKIEAVVLTGEMDAFNTFENATKVQPAAFEYTCTKDSICCSVPPCSVVAFKVAR